MVENLSIVIPVFNERDNIFPLYERITAALKGWSGIGSYEILFVDDASTDQSAEVCASIRDVRVVSIRLLVHAGQTAAIKAGIQGAHYPLVATMDADLQNDPADLPSMLNQLNAGFDFIQGSRQTREDPWLRRISSCVANAIRRRVLHDPFTDIGCSLRLFRKKCLEGVELFDGAHRFLPVLVMRNGCRVAECGVKHHPRVAGVSKYNIRNRMFKSLRDLLRVWFGCRHGVTADKMEK